MPQAGTNLCEAWGEILGDAMVAAALIDRLIHHAHIITLKGKSYRLRERTGAAAPGDLSALFAS